MPSSESTPSIRTRPRVLIVTARGWYRHLSHTIVLDFEDAMAEVADVTWHELPADAMSRSLRPRQSQIPIPIPEAGLYDVALFVAMAPSWLRALRGVRGLKTASRKVAVYVFDAWPYQLRSLRRWRQQVSWIDHLFVAYPEAVEVYAPHMQCPVHYLVQGTNPTRFRPGAGDRGIELLSVGRRHALAHRQLLRLADERDWLYVFADRAEPYSVDLDASRYLTGALSRSARTHVSWAVEYTDPARAAGYSPVTARWFEAAACASVALGIPPRSDTFSEIFPYEDFVVELNPHEVQFDRTVEDALQLSDASQRLALSEHVREHHSWQRRCERILETVIP